jgi:RND family efflux transporter MFP subunit
MKHTQWAALAGLAFVLAMAGCTSSATATPIPTVALDSDSSEISNVQASAKVVPSQEVQLSFVVSGSIKDVTVREGDTVEAGQILATLNSPDLGYSVLQAEAAVRVAEFDYEYWKLPRRVQNQVVERGPVAEKELEVTRRSLDTANAELTQTKLVAPYGATVVSIEGQPGEYVGPGQVVIVLAKLNELKIETTDLSELNVAAVEIGQPATVYVEALGEEFPGEVTAISPISSIIGGDVVYAVTINLNDQPANLLWGMSADVEIQTEQ